MKRGYSDLRSKNHSTTQNAIDLFRIDCIFAVNMVLLDMTLYIVILTIRWSL